MMVHTELCLSQNGVVHFHCSEHGILLKACECVRDRVNPLMNLPNLYCRCWIFPNDVELWRDNIIVGKPRDRLEWGDKWT